jgi:hypothetical protein
MYMFVDMDVETERSSSCASTLCCFITVQVQQEKIIRENRFQGGRKSALCGCNSHFHMYAKTPIRPLRGP